MQASQPENSPYLMAALELLGPPVLRVDAALSIREWNSQAAQLWPTQQLPCQLSDLWTGEELRQILDLLEDTERHDHSQADARQAMGELSILWKARHINASQLGGPGFCLVGIDHSAEERLEDQLQQTFRLIRDHKNALDESSIVAITDQRGIIQYVNDTFCRISGYTREELLGQSHALLKSGYHDAQFFRDLWSCIAKGDVWKGEIKNRRKDGNFYWVDTTIVPFVGEGDRPYQYIAIRNDITEKKLMQEHLEKERMRVQHAEKMASLGELAAGIAHELGNPAASINAWLDVIEAQYERNNLDIDMFMQTVPKVRRDAKRIRDIIRGMLAYARDGSRDPLQIESPQTIIQQVVDYCSYKLRKCGVQIQIDIPNPYCTLECRSTEISQMLVNFILNACDAILELEEKWIRIEAVEREAWIEFRITDSGPGISEEIADKIFNPFFTTKSVGKGTGLGLSIAKSILDNHKGHIVLDRQSLHTSFVIQLPRRQS